jgi:hypothetical protein
MFERRQPHVRIFAQLLCNLHSAGISTKASHALCLHCSHPQEVLHVTHIRRQLCELCMQMRELARLGCRGRDGGQSRGAVGVRMGCAWRARVERHRCFERNGATVLEDAGLTAIRRSCARNRQLCLLISKERVLFT